MPESIITAPLVAHDRALGAMTLVVSRPKRYGAAEVAFVEEFARRVGLKLDNARLYRAAQRAVRARDDVLGVVAHDLRNPLGAILMQVDVLRRSVEDEDPFRAAVDRIGRAAQRMNRLIDDLVDVSRMEADRLTIEPADISPRTLLSDSVDAQRATAAAASIDLRVDLPSDVPDVRADRDRLLQVLDNLVGNAIKFTEPGGRITLGAAAREDATLFWVSDTGPGIAPGDLPHVFDRFWTKSKKRGMGAGLGLAIAKRIVEAHGGRIWVDSTPGHGSTFFFTLPKRAANDEVQRPSPAAPRARVAEG
jgi:signal transduction histidine kinase